MAHALRYTVGMHAALRNHRRKIVAFVALAILACAVVQDVRFNGSPYYGVDIRTRGDLRWKWIVYNVTSHGHEFAIWDADANTLMIHVGVGPKNCAYYFFGRKDWWPK